MYAMWSSLTMEKDPFLVLPAFPVLPHFSASWPKSRIRKQIFEAESADLMMNRDALKFIRENGPDCLIKYKLVLNHLLRIDKSSCVSVNLRFWNEETEQWENNKDIAKQREFVRKFYMRCSHSVESPTMVDRGIQVILNSTIWSRSTHSDAYDNMKQRLGLSDEDDADIGNVDND